MMMKSHPSDVLGDN